LTAGRDERRQAADVDDLDDLDDVDDVDDLEMNSRMRGYTISRQRRPVKMP